MSGTLILGYTNELIEEMEEILRNIQGTIHVEIYLS